MTMDFHGIQALIDFNDNGTRRSAGPYKMALGRLLFPLEPDAMQHENVNSSQWNHTCLACGMTVCVAPSNKAGMREHRRGLRCRMNVETVKMNKKGLFLLGKNTSKHATYLKPFVVKGKFFEFYPEPIVAFLRWQHGDATPPKHANAETWKFLNMTTEEQASHLSGLLLQTEYAKEDHMESIDPEYDDPPF